MAKKTRKRSQQRHLIYFCFGDFRSGEKRYQIFTVRNIEDAYKVADELGYEIVLDNCLKNAFIVDPDKRIIASILDTIHTKLHSVENVVSCIRPEYDEAQRMKRHFLNSDMRLYFPKKLTAPVPAGLSVGGIEVRLTLRTYPWIMEYWEQQFPDPDQFQYSNLPVFRIRMLTADDEAMQDAACREKRNK